MSEYGLFDFFFDDSRERRHQEYSYERLKIKCFLKKSGKKV